MKACTKAQARTAVQICRDRIGLGTPFVNQYEVSRTLKWYVSPQATNAIQATLSRAGIPHHFNINGHWPRKTPALIVAVPRDFRVRDVKPPPKLKRPRPTKIRCPCCRSWISRRRELHYVD